MDDVTNILNKLRAAAGFTDSEISQEHPSISEKPTDSAATVHPEAALLVGRLITWASDNAARWKKVHSTLLRIYPLEWVLVEARCVLVAWVAAWLALTRAKGELARLENLRRNLTRREQIAEAARRADISFWGGLSRRLEPQIPGALAEDQQSARILAELVTGAQDGNT